MERFVKINTEIACRILKNGKFYTEKINRKTAWRHWGKALHEAIHQPRKHNVSQR